MFIWIKKNIIGIERSVESITNALQNTVKDLEAHAEAQGLAARAKGEKAYALLREKAAHEVESLKATKVAEKIGALL